MLDFDTNSRLQAAREHADRLALDMRRSRRLTQDEAGYPRLTRLAAGLRGQLGRLHHGGAQPAYDV